MVEHTQIPKNEYKHAVYLDGKVISEGDDPIIVYQNAEHKITHKGRMLILEGPYIHETTDKATLYEMRLILRGLSKGVASWAIEEAYLKVKENERDLKLLGLSEAEAVIYIVKEKATIFPSDVHRCSEIILDTKFSPQYLSKTYASAKQKLSKISIDNCKDE